MEYLETIMNIFKSVKSEDNIMGNLLPTELYNETWMLRLVLHWFNKNKGESFEGLPISMNTDSNWFSEGRMGTVFKREGNTNADGIYGNIRIGEKRFCDISLAPGCEQFVVTEAKMFSKFSDGITNNKTYNQAARNVVCMCHLAKNEINNIKDIAFYTLLPYSQIVDEKTFEEFTQVGHIKETVFKRIELLKNKKEYDKLIDWYDNDFIPFCEKVKIELISWERVNNAICLKDPDYGKTLKNYYAKCLDYGQKNKSSGKKTAKDENGYGSGVELIYCEELKTYVHFSWKGNSSNIRNYINEDDVSIDSYPTSEIKSKNLKVAKKYKKSERAKADNTKWWYSEIQKYNKQI